jgi:hypothetical protein
MSKAILEGHTKTQKHKDQKAARAAAAANKKRFAEALQRLGEQKLARLEAQSSDPALITQLGAVFKLAKHGRPMTDYPAEQQLLQLAQAPHIAIGHWTAGAAWEMAECLAEVEKQRLMKLVQAAEFLAASLDEATTVDNTAWLSSTLYVMQDWKRVHIFMGFKQVRSPQ